MKITHRQLRNIINEEIRRLTEDQLPGGFSDVPADVQTAAGELATAIASIDFTDLSVILSLASAAQELLRDAPQIAECLQAMQTGEMDLSLGVTCLALLQRWQGTLGQILPGQTDNIATIVSWALTVVPSSDGE